ncbi:MAG: hypothetical protein AAF628_17685 [Planctomycetota bacterium]
MTRYELGVPQADAPMARVYWDSKANFVEDDDWSLRHGGQQGAAVDDDPSAQADTPIFASPGYGCRIHVDTRPAAPVPDALVAPFLGVAVAQIPVPGIGTFGIDLAALPALLLASGPPVASATVNLPAAPNVLGRPLRTKSLVAPVGGGTPRLTHATTNAIG